MDNLTTIGHLPAPHDCVEISVEEWGLIKFRVDYCARPEELRAAGIVTARMDEKILHQRGGIRLDEQGRHFTVRSIDQFPKPPQLALWRSGERVRLHYYDVHHRAVLDLPGVRELYPDGLASPEDRDQARRENRRVIDRVSGSLSAQACAYAATVGDVVSRTRAVGRSQRLMHWSLINGTVIAPDWSWLRVAGGAR